jgi:hypothetical protein
MDQQFVSKTEATAARKAQRAERSKSRVAGSAEEKKAMKAAWRSTISKVINPRNGWRCPQQHWVTIAEL